MKNMVVYKKGELSWVTYIKNRIKQNLNFLSISEGATGIGKSWVMLSLANEIDPEFSVNQVAFSFKEVMEIINADWFKKKRWKQIIFDEAQTDISNRNWQSLTNKLMLYLTSTFRHQNIILYFISPYSDFVDSATMKLIHCKFIVKGHNRRTKITTVRPKLQQYNSKMRKFYEHSLMVCSRKGTMKQTHLYLPKPPERLIIPFEKKKTDFTSSLNKDILDKLNELATKNKPKNKEGRYKLNAFNLTEKQEEVLILKKELGKGSLVAKQLGVSESVVKNRLRSAKEKGFTPDTYHKLMETQEITVKNN